VSGQSLSSEHPHSLHDALAVPQTDWAETVTGIINKDKERDKETKKIINISADFPLVKNPTPCCCS
jgi:hypothetical protein